MPVGKIHYRMNYVIFSQLSGLVNESTRIKQHACAYNGQRHFIVCSRHIEHWQGTVVHRLSVVNATK